MHEGRLMSFPTVEAAYDFYQGTMSMHAEPVES
jgi:hypothetical protein